MAKQTGLVKLGGTIQDLSFYKTKDGFLAREKTSIDKERISTDPAFQRTRENVAEFGRAGSAGRILRRAFRPLLADAADGRVASRLTRAMLKVVQSDMTSIRGERTVTKGDLSLLNGFGFNVNAGLEAMVYVELTAAIDRETGEATVSIPEFIPRKSIVAPSGATHLKFVSGGAEVNFEDGTYKLVSSVSPEIAIGTQTEAAVTLTNALPAASTLPLFLVFGVEFYQQVNQAFYMLSSGAYNALSLVAVSIPVGG
ncbi:MAG: hypothetical protein AAGU19_17210 [Prolixibacteraceae bacterium]